MLHGINQSFHLGCTCQHYIYILGLPIVLAVLHRALRSAAAPAGRPAALAGWLAQAERPVCVVLCFVCPLASG